MEREQTTIRLPKDLKEAVQRKADEKQFFKQTTFRLPMELYEELEIISNQTGLTITSLLLAAIWWNVLKPTR